MFLAYVCSKPVETKLEKLETSCAVILPPANSECFPEWAVLDTGYLIELVQSLD